MPDRIVDQIGRQLRQQFLVSKHGQRHVEVDDQRLVFVSGGGLESLRDFKRYRRQVDVLEARAPRAGCC